MAILCLDDVRIFKDLKDVSYARTPDQAIKACARDWDALLLDHDLGEDYDVFDFVNWLVQLAVDGSCRRPAFSQGIFVISMNPVGAANIKRALERYYKVEITPAFKLGKIETIET